MALLAIKGLRDFGAECRIVLPEEPHSALFRMNPQVEQTICHNSVMLTSLRENASFSLLGIARF